MEPGDAGSRQSHSLQPASIASHHPAQQQHNHQSSATSTPRTPYLHLRDQPDRGYQEQPAMATATVLAPSSHYPPQNAYPSYSQLPTNAGPSPGAMISSEPPRRASDDKDTSSRQSLPSISEVISVARPSQYPPGGPQPSSQPGSGLPSPFAQGRQYAESDKHPSPQPMHMPSFGARKEPHHPYPEHVSTPYSGRHSLPPVGDRRPTPPGKPELPPQHRLADSQRPSDHHPVNGAYGHQPPPTSHPYPTPSHLPPGQVALPAYPSPRHPHAASNYDSRGAPVRHDEPDYVSRRFESSLGRHFETWSYQDSLSRIGSSARTIFNFAEAYGRIAQEQHGSQPIPERLPTEREVSEMLANVDLIKRSLEQVKDAVQVSIQNERAREGVKVKGPYDEDHDVHMYGDGMKPQYTMTEVKKRRGRAAPPGRCHSCNRIDTPEWRRGPDGARTLCNACGLHYAKLERKRQLEARSLRPKPEDRP